MEKYLAALLLALPITLNAQLVAQQTNVCVAMLDFAQAMDQHGEAPMLRGDSFREMDNLPSQILVLFVNPTTRTWTLAERRSDDVVCIIGVGENLEPLDEEGNSYETPKEDGVKS